MMESGGWTQLNRDSCNVIVGMHARLRAVEEESRSYASLRGVGALAAIVEAR
jgi:hypothetical protein